MTTEPRKHRPKDTQPFMLVGIGLTVLLVVLALPAVREWWLWLQMRGETETAEAKIIAKVPSDDGSSTDEGVSTPIQSYLVTYSFNIPASGGAEQPVTGQRRIEKSQWSSLEVGDPLTVEYVTANPTYSALKGDAYARTVSTLYLIVPLLGFAALWGSWEWETRREAKKAERRAKR
jgi:hypothetical protein